jgi:hypothetical protein
VLSLSKGMKMVVGERRESDDGRNSTTKFVLSIKCQEAASRRGAE